MRAHEELADAYARACEAPCLDALLRRNDACACAAWMLLRLSDIVCSRPLTPLQVYNEVSALARVVRDALEEICFEENHQK